MTTRKKHKPTLIQRVLLRRKQKPKRISYKEEAPRIAFARKLRLMFRRAIFIAAILLCVSLIGGGWWISSTGKLAQFMDNSEERFLSITANMGLKVTDVFLEGDHYTGTNAILAALQVEREVPILGVELAEAKKRIEALNWVKYASIERQLPGALHVHIIERKPLALWQYQGKVKLVDSDGEVIGNAPLKNFSTLPIVVGEDAAEYAPELLSLISQNQLLADKISSAIRVGQRRWDVQIKNGIEIRLPEENQQEALEHLATLHKETNILDSDVSIIDLRVPDKISIQKSKKAQNNG